MVAIVGAGPSGIYAAEALSQQADVPVEVAVIDRLPVPFGLVRYGVAPDHQSIRSIRNTLRAHPGEVRRCGSTATSAIGRDLTHRRAPGRVDAVIYAYGAGTDRQLEIPGEHLPGSIAASELVAWYCGHPDVHPDSGRPPPIVSSCCRDRQPDRTARGRGGRGGQRGPRRRPDLDQAGRGSSTTPTWPTRCSRLSGRTRVTDVHILGRRGPAYTAFTTKELRELGQLDGVDVIVNPADLELDESSQARVEQDKVAARNVAVLQEWATRTPSGAGRRLHLHFWTRPTMIIGEDRVRGGARSSGP